MYASPFELLELPDGRWCVARLTASVGGALVAGSFARPTPPPETHNSADPVGLYPSRDEAERAVERAAPARQDPLEMFSAWRCRDVTGAKRDR